MLSYQNGETSGKEMSFEEENELTPTEREMIEATKDIAIRKLRLMGREGFDYNRAWRNFVLTVISRTIDSDKTFRVTETEKDDWIEELKKVQKHYQEGKEGWSK